MQYWEVIADKLSTAGWSWGYCRAVTPHDWRWIGIRQSKTILGGNGVLILSRERIAC
jgi:hypothetical protein